MTRSKLPCEISSWWLRLALRALEAKDHELALEVWKARANNDRPDLQGLEAMTKAGLTEELRAFYAGLAETEPESSTP